MSTTPIVGAGIVGEADEVPPWNGLLRMTVRLAGHVAGLLQIPPGGGGGSRPTLSRRPTHYCVASVS